MHIQIKSASKEILGQLIDLCNSLSTEQFSKPLTLLSKNTIGKHVRHIVEFYDILIDAEQKSNTLSYDHRVHCEKTEKDIELAKNRLSRIYKWLDGLDENGSFDLNISYNKNNSECFKVKTSLDRELVYNIEHAIHHMAIIRIAVENELKSVNLDQHFGVAYSTIRFRDDLCAH